MIDICNYLDVQLFFVTTLSTSQATPALRFLTAHWGLGRALAEHLEPLLTRTYDLELRAYLVLSSVSRGIVYPSDLADRLSLPRDTTSRLLQILLKKGLITKRIDPDDSRRIQQSVTLAGETLLREARATLETILEPLLDDLGADSLEHFLTTTETLRSQIAQTLGERCAASIPTR